MSQSIIEKLNIQKNAYIFLQMAAVYFLQLSVFAAFLSVFSMEVSLYSIGMQLFVAVLLGFGFTAAMRWGRKLFISIPLIAILVLVFRNFIVGNMAQYFVKGAAAFYNSFISLYNQYYDVNFLLIHRTISNKDIMVTVFAAQMVLSVLLTWIIRKKRAVIFAVLIALLPVISAAIVGFMPDDTSSWGLILAVSMYLILYHSEENENLKEELFWGLGVLVILYLSSLIFTPGIENIRQKHAVEYTQVRENIQNLSMNQLVEKMKNIGKGPEDYSEGGIGEGNFKGLSKFIKHGRKHMEVTLSEKPKENIYLKAFVGTEYTKNGWKEIRDSQLSEIIPVFIGQDKKRELLNEPFRRITEGTVNLEKCHIDINITKASKQYGYMPYYSEITDDKTVNKDATVKGQGEKKQSYDFYFRNEAGKIDSSRLDNESALWEEYVSFVGEIYSRFPSDLEEIENITENINKISVEDVKIGIDVFFGEDFLYSSIPGECPADEDFVEYFLFENKKGFCVHFATAATMIYRQCGYPARYVEGYMIPADKFIKQEDGTYKAEVTDKMAHAWCETFHSEMGWQVREHTLGYEDVSDSYSVNNVNNQNLQNNENTNRETVRQEETTTQRVTVAESKRDVETETKKNNGASAKGNITKDKKEEKGLKSKYVILVCIVLVILFQLQARARFQRKIQSFGSKKNNRGIANIYNAVYRICVFHGMRVSNKSDEAIKNCMKAEFGQLKEEEWEWMYDCAKRAAFSNEKIERKEYKNMKKMYFRFRREVLKEMNIWKKLIFIYIIVL